MAATATARSTAPAKRAPARRAPARREPGRPAPRRRRQHTPAAGFVVPAALRTAGAVGGIADSGIVVRLTRGRLWIGMLAALLVGIVALNVMALNFSSSSSEAARQADTLKRQNSALRAQIAKLTASEQVQQTAGRLGLHIPDPGQIGYLKPRPGDAAKAAARQRAGELSGAAYVPVAEAVVTDPAAAPVETAVPAIDPAATDTTLATTETAAAPAVSEPTTPAAEPAPAVSGGGVSSP